MYLSLHWFGSGLVLRQLNENSLIRYFDLALHHKIQNNNCKIIDDFLVLWLHLWWRISTGNVVNEIISKTIDKNIDREIRYCHRSFNYPKLSGK